MTVYIAHWNSTMFLQILLPLLFCPFSFCSVDGWKTETNWTCVQCASFLSCITNAIFQKLFTWCDRMSLINIFKYIQFAAETVAAQQYCSCLAFFTFLSFIFLVSFYFNFVPFVHALTVQIFKMYLFAVGFVTRASIRSVISWWSTSILYIRTRTVIHTYIYFTRNQFCTQTWKRVSVSVYFM